MLTDLSFLETGQTFPPPSQQERLQTYRDNKLLFEGDHDQVYKDWVRTIRADQNAKLELIFNFPARMTKLFADLMLGEPPIIRVKEKKAEPFYPRRTPRQREKTP